MNLNHTPQQPILIRKRDWLRLPEDQRGISADNQVLVMTAGGRFVPAQVID